MKKKTVITTEKREVWLIREAIPESLDGQSDDVSNAIAVPAPDYDLQDLDDFEDEEEK